MSARRPRWWGVGFLLILALVGLGLVRVADDDPYRPQTTPVAPRGVDRPAASRALTEVVDAVGDRDRGAAAVDAVASIVGNAAALDVRDFALRYLDEAGAVAADGGWVAEAEATWRFAGFDRVPITTEVLVSFRRIGDAVAVVGFGQGATAGRTPLWLRGPVTVRRTPETLVLDARGPAVVERMSRLAARAVPVVRRVLPGWRGRLVVEVPGSVQELHEVLGAQPPLYDAVAAVTTSVDGVVGSGAAPHVFVNPDVLGGLRPQGAQVVLSHEATHVATLANGGSTVPTWLLEGFADYVALRDIDLPFSATAGLIREVVRRDGVPRRLPGEAEFATTNPDLGAAYESAWIACVELVELAGERQLVQLYGLVDAGADLKTALQRLIGIEMVELTGLWRARLVAVSQSQQ